MSVPLFDVYQTNTTIYLRDVVRSLRECKSTAEEREFVAKETAEIRQIFREEKNELRAIAVIKLLYFYILGYPAHIGQVECLKLIASERFSDKRIGYLGCMMLLDELAEIHVLLTNCIKNDLENPNKYVKGLALCTFASICSEEMSESLGPYIENLLDFPDRYIRKKAILCVLRIIKKCPDLIPNYLQYMENITKESSPAMQMCLISLAIEMCEKSHEALQFFKNMKGLIGFIKKILITLMTHGTSSDYCVHGASNPFLQIKCIRFFKYLAVNDAVLSAEITDVLAQVITSTSNKLVVGFSIIYEAIACIMAIESKKDLKLLAINSVGPFLKSNIKNVRFIGLTTLQRAAVSDPELIVCHKDLINKCVLDNDDTIKKRSIELLFSILDSQDMVDAVENLLDNIPQFSDDLKRFATSFIVTAIERYSPSQKWMIDQFLKLMQHVSSYIRDDTLVRFVGIISNCPLEQQISITHRFYTLLCSLPKQDVLIQLACWCVGEYGYMLLNSPYNISMNEIVEIMRRNFTQPDFKLNTYHYIENALFKFSIRVPQALEYLKHLIDNLKRSLDTELQQRAVEFDILLNQHHELKDLLFSPMPPIELETLSDIPLAYDDESFASNHRLSFKHSVPLNDINNICTSESNQQSINDTTNMNIVHDLLDLLEDSYPSTNHLDNITSGHIDKNIIINNIETLPVIYNNQDGIKLDLLYNYPQKDPHLRTLCLCVTNTSLDDIENFNVQMAVTKNFMIKMEQQSGHVLKSLGLNQINQKFSLYLQQPYTFSSAQPKLRLKLTYTKLGVNQEIIQNISTFPSTFN